MKKIAIITLLPVLVAVVAFTGTAEISAEQNCVAWEQVMRSSAGGEDRAGVGRPVIDRLTGDEPYGHLVGDWVADNCMRLNHVQVVGTHNPKRNAVEICRIRLLQRVADRQTLLARDGAPDHSADPTGNEHEKFRCGSEKNVSAGDQTEP